MPNVVVGLEYTPIFEWDLVGCLSKNGTPNKHVLKRNWTMCSKFINHSRYNNPHNGGEGRRPMDHLITQRIFTLRINMIFIRTPYMMKTMATGTIWICQSSRTSCVFHIL